MKLLVIIAAVIAGAVLAVFLAYLLYLWVKSFRIQDQLPLEISGSEPSSRQIAIPGKEYSILSYNIGFGAFVQDYSFFMDGGKESRARSRESVCQTIEAISQQINGYNADISLIQEVDRNSTRSYHLDELELLRQKLKGQQTVFACNYHSPYLIVPISCPHGASVSGIATFSKLLIDSAKRFCLPIQNGFARLMDLDRCYSVSKIPVEGNRYLCIYSLHLSAYSTDPTLSDRQVKVLVEDMEQQRKQGNYVIAGGDFNKDFLGYSGDWFVSNGEKHSGVSPFPFYLIPQSIQVVFPYDKEHAVATCRNAHMPYVEGVTYLQTIDAFLVSDNIEVKSIEVINEKYRYSDHNPIVMSFKLKGD